MLEKNNNMNLYYYSGFEEPKEIDLGDLVVRSNYLGDVTDVFMEEYNEVVKVESLGSMQENQFFYQWKIWVNPTLEQLRDYNKSVCLEEDSYLDRFNGYKKFY